MLSLRERRQGPRRPAFSVACSQGRLIGLWLPVCLRQTPGDPLFGRASTSLQSGWGGWQGKNGAKPDSFWIVFFFFLLSIQQHLSNPVISFPAASQAVFLLEHVSLLLTTVQWLFMYPTETFQTMAPKGPSEASTPILPTSTLSHSAPRSAPLNSSFSSLASQFKCCFLLQAFSDPVYFLPGIFPNPKVCLFVSLLMCLLPLNVPSATTGIFTVLFTDI